MGQWAEMVPVKRRGTYGITILRNGVQLRSDGRLRFKRSRPSEWGPEYALRPGGARGKVGGWSEASARRLAFVAANADSTFTSLLTLTYRARTEAWEPDAERNRRVIRRSQADRHRFLRCLRGELGHYLWVREFQTRGVVHYHVLCERVITQERATVAWCRATGQLEDAAVLRHGVKVDEVSSQGGVEWPQSSDHRLWQGLRRDGVNFGLHPLACLGAEQGALGACLAGYRCGSAAFAGRQKMQNRREGASEESREALECAECGNVARKSETRWTTYGRYT